MSLARLQTPDPIWRPYAFDRVTVHGHIPGERTSGPLFSFLAPCWSEYSSGPNLITLADAAAEIVGPGWYGLASCRPRGFRTLD